MARATSRSRAVAGVLTALVLLGASIGSAGGTLADAVDPRYPRLVDGVLSGDIEAKRRFAEVALMAVIDANRREIARAAAGRWQAATRAYVARLERMAAHVAGASRIDVVRETRGGVRVVIDDEQAMINSPRLSDQQRLESAIAVALCTELECPEAAPTVAAAVAERQRDVREEWQFGDRGPPLMSASDGLHCVFEDMRHLRLKEAACTEILRELRLVAEALRGVVQQGASVDWSAFTIAQGPPGRGQRVVFDRLNGFFEIDLPYLAAEEALWRGAIPWWQSQLRGYPANYVVKTPERLAYRLPAE